MINQPVDAKSLNNSAAVKIPPAERIYAVKDLPKEVREKLLSLQNADGDFLKTSEKRTVLAQIIFLFLLLNFFGIFVSAFDFSDFGAGKAVVFSDGFIF